MLDRVSDVLAQIGEGDDLIALRGGLVRRQAQ